MVRRPDGVMVPPVQQVSRVFRMFFVDDPAELSAALGVDYTLDLAGHRRIAYGVPGPRP